MRRAFILLSYILWLNTSIVWANDVRDTGLAILDITTMDGQEPECEFVFAPENAFGIGIRNCTKIKGRIILTEQGDTLYDSGDYEKDQHGMTIRIRGNTSAYYSVKKPYKIKLEKKNDLFNRRDSAYYDKNWILIDDGGDMLNTMIGLKVNELIGLGGWTPAYKFVNLFMNGDYRCVYMLVESIKRNADCRLNVDKHTGYIIERDAYWWNEEVWFSSESGKQFTFKYPDDKDVTSQQTDYIQQTINDVERAIAQGNYPEYIDVNSFAAWMLAHDILGTKDSGGANIYLTKYDDSQDSKVSMSTLWDFGSIMKTPNTWSRIRTDDFFYFKQLFENKNNSFTATYMNLWERLSDSLFLSIKEFLTYFASSPTASAIDMSRHYDGQRWNYEPSSVNDNVEEALSWFSQRQKWISQQLATDHISHTENAKHPVHEKTYNIGGHPTKTEKTGIYISNGKKYIAGKTIR